MQYQQWLRVFQPSEKTTNVVKVPIASSRFRGECHSSDGLFHYVVGYAHDMQQHGYYLSFTKVEGRWRAVVVEVADDALDMNINLEIEDEPGNRSCPAVFIQDSVSLSTVSTLGFSTNDFNPESAFQAIESVFWCINNTRSEQLLDERRRHSTANNRHFSSVDFRNFLESADRWYCTDVRDRVFGVLGVFQIWPQPHPFRDDYRLSTKDLMVELVDYCRPTDPFKLAIRLILALRIELYDVKGGILVHWSTAYDGHEQDSLAAVTVPCRSDTMSTWRQ